MELASLSADEINTIQMLLILSLLTLPLKALALWKAAQLRQKVWFVFLLAINTLGILDIIYYFFVNTHMASKKARE